MFIGSYCKQQCNNKQRQEEPKADQNRPMRKQSKEAVIELSPFPNPIGLEGEELENALKRLCIIMKADPLEMFRRDKRGILHLRQPHQIPLSLQPAIKALHRDKEGNLSYELHSRIKAVEALRPFLKDGSIINYYPYPPAQW